MTKYVENHEIHVENSQERLRIKKKRVPGPGNKSTPDGTRQASTWIPQTGPVAQIHQNPMVSFQSPSGMTGLWGCLDFTLCEQLRRLHHSPLPVLACPADTMLAESCPDFCGSPAEYL